MEQPIYKTSKGENMKKNIVKICFASVMAGMIVMSSSSGSGSSKTKQTSGTGVTVIEYSPETEQTSVENSEPVSILDQSSSVSETDTRKEKIPVPNVLELSKEKAISKLEESGFVPDVKENYNIKIDKGLVFVQSPNADVMLEKGAKVTIIVSLGKKPETTSKPEEKSKPETTSKPEEKSKPETTSKPEEDSKPSSAEIYAAYRKKVDELVKMYGKPKIGIDEFFMKTDYKGLSVVRLIDFDGDGQDELLCGYSENGTYINTQEIFGYIKGKVVSLFKGGVNSTQVLYLEIVKKGNKSYLCTDALFKMPDDEWKWIGIKDNKSYLADNNKSFMDDGEKTVINLNYWSGYNTMTETLSVFKKIGYKCEDVIEEAAYQEQTEKYEKYLKDNYGDIVSRVPSPTGSRLGVMDDIKELYYDFDNDGILEMWFSASETQAINRPMTVSLFCTINNGKVEELLNEKTSGGSFGGTRVTLTYSEHDDSLKIGVSHFCGGWGGSLYGLTSYNYSNGKLEKCLEYSGSFPNNGQSECMINGKSVSQDEYIDYTAKLHNLFIENATKVLFYSPTTTSVYERLVQLKVIYPA